MDNPYFHGACITATGALIAGMLESCSTGVGVAAPCTAFCATTDATIAATIVAAGLANPISDLTVAALAVDYGLGCEAACVSTISAGCASMKASSVPAKIAAAAATTAFCTNVLH